MTNNPLIQQMNPLLYACIERQLDDLAKENSRQPIDKAWLSGHLHAQVTRYDTDGCACEFRLDPHEKGESVEPLYLQLLTKLRKLRIGSLEADHGVTTLTTQSREDFALWLHLAGLLPNLDPQTLKPREDSPHAATIAERIMRANGELDDDTLTRLRRDNARNGYRRLFDAKEQRQLAQAGKDGANARS